MSNFYSFVTEVNAVFKDYVTDSYCSLLRHLFFLVSQTCSVTTHLQNAISRVKNTSLVGILFAPPRPKTNSQRKRLLCILSTNAKLISLRCLRHVLGSLVRADTFEIRKSQHHLLYRILLR
jgi:hypothetical protein